MPSFLNELNKKKTKNKSFLGALSGIDRPAIEQARNIEAGQFEPTFFEKTQQVAQQRQQQEPSFFEKVASVARKPIGTEIPVEQPKSFLDEIKRGSGTNERQRFASRNQPEIQQRQEDAKIRKESRNVAKENMDRIQEEIRQLTIQGGNAERVRELSQEFMNEQAVANVRGRGVIEGLPFGKQLIKPLDTVFDTDEELIQQARETPEFKQGFVGGKILGTAAQYQAVNAALGATKFGGWLTSKLGSQFAANQAVDLVADRIVQAPQEWIPLLKGEKDLGETFWNLAGNTAIDIGLNLVIGRLSDAKGFQEAFQGKEVTNLKKVIEELGDDGRQIALNRIKQLDPAQASKVSDVLGLNTIKTQDRALTEGLEVNPFKQSVEPAKIDGDLSTTVDIPVEKPIVQQAPRVDEDGFDIVYHGSGTKGLTAKSLEPRLTNTEGLFGPGIYLTDSKDIAGGYARARSKRRGVPTIYQASIDRSKLLDLEVPFDEQVLNEYRRALEPVDDLFDTNITSIINDNKGDTGYDLYRKITDEMSGAVSKSESEEILTELQINLKEIGYDGYKHVGGKLTGADPHEVSILFDPNDLYSRGASQPIKKFGVQIDEPEPNVFRQTLEDSRKAAADDARIDEFEFAPGKESPQAAKIEGEDDLVTTFEIPGIETTVKRNADGTAKRTKDGQIERGFSRNIRTDQAIAPEANASFDKDSDFYTELTNATTLDKALARFDKGYEEALKDFDLTKTEFTPDNVVLAKLLANEAAAQGDLFAMRRVLSDVAETLTQAGQYSQAAKILREANDPATVLQYLEREIKKLNDQGLKRYGPRKKKLIGKGEKGWKKIELSEEELAKVAKFTSETTDAEKTQLFEELYESISKRIPTTRREKFDSWRRIAMLTNPKTHARNLLGNSMMAAVKKVADTEAAVLEKAFLPQAERTKSVFANKANRKTATKYWDEHTKELSEGSRWEIFGIKSPFAEKKIFDTGVNFKETDGKITTGAKKLKDFSNKALEKVSKFSKDTLEVEDIIFLKKHFVRDLAGFMQARGMTEPTQEAVAYALRRAQEATFREQNALADIIAKGKKSQYGLLVEAAIPFSKTPANIAQTGIDYSPIGVVKSIAKIAGNAPAAEAIEIFSKGTTGAGLSALGAYMAFNGMARGEYKADPEEEALLSRAGILPNSIVMKNGSYTIDWAQPAAIPYFMGVAFAEEMMKKEESGIVDATATAVTSGIDTIFKQTMLSGITDFFGGYDGVAKKIFELPLDYIGQGIPTVGGQIARTVDPVKRERDYSSILKTFKTQAQSKTPGLTTSLPPKRGIFGEELKYGEGALNAVQQFLSPGFFAKKQDDALTNELLRLYNEVGKSFLPRARVKNVTSKKVKYELTTQEKSDFQKVMGEYTEQGLKTLFNSSNYQNSSDEEKAKAVKKVNDEGYDLAKEDFLEGKE